MTTHSSFFTFSGVVDQFTQLQNALNSVLGLFGLIHWLRDILISRRAEVDAQRVSCVPQWPSRARTRDETIEVATAAQGKQKATCVLRSITRHTVRYAQARENPRRLRCATRRRRTATTFPEPSPAAARTTTASRSITTRVCAHCSSVPGVHAVGIEFAGERDRGRGGQVGSEHRVGG